MPLIYDANLGDPIGVIKLMSSICGANFVTNLVTKLVLFLNAHIESLEIWVIKIS
jgi:hypothetical protein